MKKYAKTLLVKCANKIYHATKPGEQQYVIPSTQVLTVEDIMEKLHVCRNTVYGLLSSGQIKGFKIGRTWRITEKALNEFLERV